MRLVPWTQAESLLALGCGPFATGITSFATFTGRYFCIETDEYLLGAASMRSLQRV